MSRFADYEPGRRAGARPPDLRIRAATAADIPALAGIRATRGDCTAEQARTGFERTLARAAKRRVSQDVSASVRAAERAFAR